MKPSTIVSVATLVLVASTAPLSAQTRVLTERVFVSANGGFRATERQFDDNVTFTAYVEQGDFDATYKVRAAPVFDASAGVRLWRNLGAGAAVSSYSKASAGGVTGRIPHPFFFDRRREVAGESDALTHDEMALHVQGLWMIPATNRIDIAIFGGPSFMRVRLALVDSLRYNDTFPYDTATLTGTNAGMRTQNASGFNLGGDVSYMLTKRVGVGGMVRVSHADAELISQDGGILTVKLGGTHAAAGIRLRF